jgi:hypothetical protein
VTGHGDDCPAGYGRQVGGYSDEPTTGPYHASLESGTGRRAKMPHMTDSLLCMNIRRRLQEPE